MSISSNGNGASYTGLDAQNFFRGLQMSEQIKNDVNKSRNGGTRSQNPTTDLPNIKLGSPDFLKNIAHGLISFVEWQQKQVANSDYISFFDPRTSEDTEPYPGLPMDLRISDVFILKEMTTNGWEKGTGSEFLGGDWSSQSGNYWNVFVGTRGAGIQIRFSDHPYDLRLVDIKTKSHIGFNGEFSRGTIDLVGVEPYGNTFRDVNVLRLKFDNQQIYNYWTSLIDRNE